MQRYSNQLRSFKRKGNNAMSFLINVERKFRVTIKEQRKGVTGAWETVTHFDKYLTLDEINDLRKKVNKELRLEKEKKL